LDSSKSWQSYFNWDIRCWPIGWRGIILMWQNLKHIANNAVAFLSSSKIPPGTPVALQESMRNENHFKSKKFFLAFSSFIGLLGFYLLSVAILFLLPTKNELIAGYVTIFTKTIEIIAIIVAVYLGTQATIDFKYGSNSNVNLDSTLTSEQREEKIIYEETVVYAEKYKNDLSYAPIDWVMTYE
jgi:hypothetical protein